MFRVWQGKKKGGNDRVTGPGELGEEQTLPRGQIIRQQSAEAVPDDVSGDDEEAIPGRVEDDPERGVAGEVSAGDQGDLLEDGLRRVVRRHGDLRDAAGEGGDEEAAAEWVPLGALAEPAGAVVEVHVAGRGGEFEGYEVSQWDGRGQGEEEEGLGGAKARATTHYCLLFFFFFFWVVWWWRERMGRAWRVNWVCLCLLIGKKTICVFILMVLLLIN